MLFVTVNTMNNQRFSLFPNAPRLRDLANWRALRYQWRSGGPVITEAIIALCVAVWAVEIVLRLVSSSALNGMLSSGMFRPLLAVARPWTFVTSMFLHEPGVMHVLFNMLTLWCVGPLLERLLGHWPFLAMYLLSGIGGGMGLMLWAAAYPGGSGWMSASYGASGAIFGLFAAVLVVYRRIGADIRSMLVWMAINFAMPLVVPNIAWQAHAGGFVIGGAMSWLLVSGFKPLRGKSIAFRTAVYGVALLAVMIVVIALCNASNPLGALSSLFGSLL